MKVPINMTAVVQRTRNLGLVSVLHPGLSELHIFVHWNLQCIWRLWLHSEF